MGTVTMMSSPPFEAIRKYSAACKSGTIAFLRLCHFFRSSNETIRNSWRIKAQFVIFFILWLHRSSLDRTKLLVPKKSRGGAIERILEV